MIGITIFRDRANTWEPMAREPDVALLMTGKLHKRTHLLVFLIITWGAYGSYGSLSQKGSRPLY